MACPFMQTLNRLNWTEKAQFEPLYLVALILSNQYFMGIMSIASSLPCLTSALEAARMNEWDTWRFH